MYRGFASVAKIARFVGAAGDGEDAIVARIA